MSPLSAPVLGQYVPGDSILHRLDPRTKIVVIFVYMLIVFLANNGITYGLLIVTTSVGVFLSGVPILMILRGLKPVFILIAFTACLHLFFTKGGEVLFSMGPITIEEKGVMQAGWISLRFMLLVVTGMLLTLTTSSIDLTDGMERLLTPLRRVGVPAHELALMMSISLRFIPTLWEETNKIMKAQQARGADFESGSIFKRLKSFIPVLIPLFVSAFRRAEELALAMEARGYRGGQGRTRLRKLTFTGNDSIAFILLFLLVIGLIGLRSQ
ncbi:energy-coupling factor transporter transmembrane component T family protein [Marininema halotolerans]|uniref:Energy-coupling factor transporter transmembrane protein EcfT n=1 Tax=Marininema halotolerans TaxID=1155944 RepID=A0A1I6T4U0_9BACL|nr:energy-coupling factor transporter transmembrane component T [Marininema halotolerans]SFS84244.1 energy-coupling factor transport system permease protein [Marininema halotolerans]